MGIVLMKYSIAIALSAALLTLLICSCLCRNPLDCGLSESQVSERLHNELSVGDPASRIEEVLTRLGVGFTYNQYSNRYEGTVTKSRRYAWNGAQDSVISVYVDLTKDRSFSSFEVHTSHTSL